MNKDIISEIVKSAITKSVNSRGVVESVNSDAVVVVESHSSQLQETVIEEGLGSGLLKAFGLYAGANIGSSLVGGFGYLSGGALAAVLASAGLVAASAIVPITLGAGLTGAVYGLYKGGRMGLDLARSATKKDHEKVIEKLIDVTNKRDELIKQVGNDKVPQDSIQKQIDKITSEQMKLGQKLLKEIDFSKGKNFIDSTEYTALKAIASAAKDGKFTYIGK